MSPDPTLPTGDAATGRKEAPPRDEERKAAICEAAFRTFCRYGLRRSSMEEIARAAEMSRPSLYQHFRNKDDILRSLVARHYDTAIADTAAALGRPGDPADLLEDAFRERWGRACAGLLEAPHGRALFASGTAAADQVAEGEDRLRQCYSDWLWREAVARRITLIEPPEEVARTLIAALDGGFAPPYEAYARHLKRLSRLFARGLAARGGG